MSPIIFCLSFLPNLHNSHPLVAETGNHRGEDTHKQNTGHKNESPE